MAPLPHPVAALSPETITNIVYKAVMILVSIAFICLQYRRSVRPVDEEYVIGILIPSPLSETHHKPSISAKEFNASSTHTLQPRSRTSRATQSLITSQVEDIALSSLGLGSAAPRHPSRATTIGMHGAFSKDDSAKTVVRGLGSRTGDASRRNIKVKS